MGEFMGITYELFSKFLIYYKSRPDLISWNKNPALFKINEKSTRVIWNRKPGELEGSDRKDGQ